jgi:FtsZ-binding cell division protein ZapB
MGQTDTLANEPMQLRIGPEIYEKLRFSLPDEMFDEDNKGLINWFHIQLYQVPAQEFLQIMGDVISSDESKNRKATERFEEIMREAQELKSEYDNWKEEKDEDSSDDLGGDDGDDDDDLDDFLGGLGISRPK